MISTGPVWWQLWEQAADDVVITGMTGKIQYVNP
jgi:hypothetical protein